MADISPTLGEKPNLTDPERGPETGELVTNKTSGWTKILIIRVLSLENRDNDVASFVLDHTKLQCLPRKLGWPQLARLLRTLLRGRCSV